MTHTDFQSPEAFITYLTKWGFKKYGPVKTVGDFDIYRANLTSLKLNVGILVPFIVSKRLSGQETVNSELIAELLPDLDTLARSLQRRILVLVVGGELAALEKPLIADLKMLGVAIIDRPVIEGIYRTENPEEKADLLGWALVRYLGRETLSPYVSGRPAVGGCFFGRASLVQQLVSSFGNFTIVGNRRIGKTSLLKEIKERLKLQNVLTAEIYGATCYSTEDVVYKLLQSLDRFREADRMLTDPSRVKQLAHVVHRISDTENRPIAVFIDEVDTILEFDEAQNYELTHLLRETFEGHPYCRVFLAGFRKIMQLKQSINFPGFNFTMPVELGLFNRQETYEMITKPLHRLDIEVSNTELPEAIYQETAGHPELIQIHCAHIVRYMQEHAKVPTGVDLLMNVLNSTEYKQKVLGTFLSNTNAYEELLCYLLFADAEKTEHPSEYEFGLKDVNRVLETAGIKLELLDMHRIIMNLKVSAIIKQVAGVHEKFQFATPQLVAYCMGLNLDFLIARSLESVRSQRKSLWEEPEHPEIGWDSPVGGIHSSPGRVKHIYLVTGGGAIIAAPEGVTTLSGSIDESQIEDLNHRCLEMVDRWTDHKTFEQRLTGIGNQLSTALKSGIPELPRHLDSHSDSGQILITSSGAGLKIPFELLPQEKSHLAVTAAVARSILNYRLPASVQFPFHQLITSLRDRTESLRVLLVASDPQRNISETLNELSAVKKHIEAGCKQMRLDVEFVEIPPDAATIEHVESTLVKDRPFHIWHFTGHGKHSAEDADASGIFLRRKDGEPDVVACKRLNRWLKGSGLWLTYLSCCHTSAASGSGIGLSQKYVGTMEAMVAAGIPNVIGFRWSVSDQSALYLADEFYRQLFEVQSEKNLSLAMLEARRAVESRSDFFDAWASSMLITQYS